MIQRPPGIGAFHFAVLASLRAAQLCRGCTPRVEGDHTIAVTAQMEVANGALVAEVEAAAPSSAPIDPTLVATAI